jgi:hypothetical protein
VIAQRFVALSLVVSLTACGGPSESSTPTAPSGPVTTLGLFIVGLPPVSMVIGQTITLRAVVRYSDRTSTDVTANTSWSSDTSAVAPISPAGTINAMASGMTTISAFHAGLHASASLQVSDSWAADQDFRVAILNVTSTPKLASDVARVFEVASEILHWRTGARMRIVDMQEAGPGSPRGWAEEYLASLTGDLPDGVLAWAEDTNAVAFGGYSTQIAMPEPYANRYPGAGSATCPATASAGIGPGSSASTTGASGSVRMWLKTSTPSRTCSRRPRLSTSSCTRSAAPATTITTARRRAARGWA